MTREHCELLRSMAEIYKHAMLHHEVQGPIPIILVEDETKIKRRISWEQRWTLWLDFVVRS